MISKQSGLIFLILSILFICNVEYAQNLIINGDFERHRSCPFQISQINLLENWFSPNQGTPDLYCVCSSRRYIEVGVPLNTSGFQPSQSGDCYMGIICYNDKNRNHKEYASIKLSEKLKRGRRYCLSFYYSRSNYSDYKIRTFGALLTKKRISLKNGEVILNPNIECEITDDTLSWQKFNSLYVSSGGEKFLTIGSFLDNAESCQPEKIPLKISRLKLNNSGCAYYYIDNISFVEIKGGEKCECETLGIDPEIGMSKSETVTVDYEMAREKPMPIQNLTFETNKATIESSSFGELDRLVNFLTIHGSFRIKLSGYTDNIGKEQENLKLSMDRAKAVADYLIQKGVNTDRISYNGFGSSNPVADNSSEKGRLMNRRVEFMLLK